VHIVNQTEGFPEKLRPGMLVNSTSVDSMARHEPEKLKAIEEIAGAYVADWEKQLSGKRGLKRIQKIVAFLFGVSSHTEYIRVEKFGTDNSYSFKSIRVPDNV
jgi:hypothetical protein